MFMRRRLYTQLRAGRTMATNATSTRGWPTVVQPSKSEQRNAHLETRNLETAVRHLHEDGLVVINDVVLHNDLDKLNEKMVVDALALQARGDNSPFNYNRGNLQQDAPPVAEYFFPSIFTSE